MGGHKDDHEGQDSSELMMEHLEVGVAVSDEAVHVIVVAFEEFGGLHEDGTNP